MVQGSWYLQMQAGKMEEVFSSQGYENIEAT